MTGSRPVWRTRFIAGLAVSGLFAIIGGALALHRFGAAQAVHPTAVRRFPAFPPVPSEQVSPLQMHVAAVYPAVIGLILLLAGIAGLTLTILHWSPWAGPGHGPRRRPYRNQTPGGPRYS